MIAHNIITFVTVKIAPILDRCRIPHSTGTTAYNAFKASYFIFSLPFIKDSCWLYQFEMDYCFLVIPETSFVCKKSLKIPKG
jgi:hypothetical protein